MSEATEVITNSKPNSKPIVEQEKDTRTKPCNECKKVKSVSEFNPAKSDPKKFAIVCKECHPIVVKRTQEGILKKKEASSGKSSKPESKKYEKKEKYTKRESEEQENEKPAKRETGEQKSVKPEIDEKKDNKKYVSIFKYQQLEEELDDAMDAADAFKKKIKKQKEIIAKFDDDKEKLSDALEDMKKFRKIIKEKDITIAKLSEGDERVTKLEVQIKELDKTIKRKDEIISNLNGEEEKLTNALEIIKTLSKKVEEHTNEKAELEEKLINSDIQIRELMEKNEAQETQYRADLIKVKENYAEELKQFEAEIKSNLLD